MNRKLTFKIQPARDKLAGWEKLQLPGSPVFLLPAGFSLGVKQ